MSQPPTLFGWHAHFQDRGVGVTRAFDEYLAEIELAEELGFDEMWLTEHHFHPYGMACLLYTSPSPRDRQKSRMPSSA